MKRSRFELVGRKVSEDGMCETDEGFVVLLGVGSRWGDGLFATRKCAEKTAAECLGERAFTIAPAKRIRRYPHRRWDWIIAEGNA